MQRYGITERLGIGAPDAGHYAGAGAGATFVVDLEPGPAAPTVPGRQRLGEARRAHDLEVTGPKRIHPLDPAEVPLGEGLGRGGHNEVLVEAGIRPADLCPVAVEDDPQLVGFSRSVGEIEADNDAHVG